MSAGTDFVSMLVEMGFSKEKAERGLSMTGNKGVEAAMEWIFSHPEEFEASTSKTETQSSSSEQESSTAEQDATAEEAKSLKCDDCGKLFKTQLEVEYHASKTGHGNFSESTEEKKPLTEEERQEQLRLIELKLKEKRKEREEKEKEEALNKEKRRIQSGKEITEARRKMEELEMKKVLEQRKREKEEEKQARLRVKRLIEADRQARKGVTNAEATEQIAVVNAQPAPLPLNTAPKEYTQSRIQIRLTNGSVLTQTFNVKEQLAAIRLYVEMNRTDDNGPFSLMTSFPKKVFTTEDYERRLEDLGLVPTAVLIVTKGTSA